MRRIFEIKDKSTSTSRIEVEPRFSEQQFNLVDLAILICFREISSQLYGPDEIVSPSRQTSAFNDDRIKFIANVAGYNLVIAPDRYGKNIYVRTAHNKSEGSENLLRLAVNQLVTAFSKIDD